MKPIHLLALTVSLFTRSPLAKPLAMPTPENQIQATIQSVFNGSDTRNWALVESSFAPQVTLDYTSLAGGKPASLSPRQITDAWRAVFHGFASTHHQIGQFKISVAGKTASASHRGLALHYLPGAQGGDYWAVCGAYTYTLSLAGSKWVINNMKFDALAQRGNRALPQLAAAATKSQITAAKLASPSPQTLAAVNTFFTSLEQLDIPPFLAGWDEQGRQVMPFAPIGFPGELVGKPAIARQYGGLPSAYKAMQFPRKVYPTTDPHTVIVQYTGTIDLKQGGQYNNTYVSVFTEKDGKLTHNTEYFDPQVLSDAFGASMKATFGTASNNDPRIRKVTFVSHGQPLKGNLYLPDGFDEAKQYPTLVVAGSWLTVKEQMPALYARAWADRGYVALAFDFRYFGESGGQPRNYENPAAKTEDISAAVDFLSTLKFVNASRIGGMGVCASSGYMAQAAVTDSRIKTVTLLAPWLHDPAMAKAIYDTRPGGTAGLLARADAATTAFAKEGKTATVAAASTTDAYAAMYLPDPQWDYYLNPDKGAVPSWPNQFAEMSWRPWLTYNAIDIARQVKQPVYMVASEQGAIPDGARRFHALLPGEKELIWLNDYNQLELYIVPDAVNQVVDQAEPWLAKHL
jgi:fermentation-respiration switch protein FrsA (DUF1100 family)/ketosteroid isomerase-like protein